MDKMLASVLVRKEQLVMLGGIMLNHMRNKINENFFYNEEKVH